MKHVALLITSVICFQLTIGQRYDVGAMPMQGNTPFIISGQQVNAIHFTRLVEGSPFLFEEFLEGTITNPKGLKYNGVKMKLNLLANELYFINENGQELQLVSVVEKISLKDKEAMGELVFRYVPKSKAGAPWGWLEVLGKGKTLQICKRHLKTLEETTPYASSILEQRILTSFQYWVLYENNWIRVKRLEDVAEINTATKKDVLTYIKVNNLSAKDDWDWATLAAAF